MLNPTHTDSRFQRRNARLVAALRKKGIPDEAVLAAVRRVPRHHFVEQAFLHRAYRDEALPIGMNQTISQPFTVAFQTMLLAPQAGEKVLEIGTGSGYQAAVLHQMGADVYSVERHAPLLKRAKHIFSTLRYRIRTRLGDGTQGWPAFAPYDAILVTAAAAHIPEALKAQLRAPADGVPGGRLVIPVGGVDGQTMCRIVRTGADTYATETLGQFRFVPLIGADGGQIERP